jgi:hypothetical protein
LTPPERDPGADAEVNTLAHEIEETTTDLMVMWSMSALGER